jgi:anaerobic selenocysteine-containing dehydrogenase
MGKIVAKKRPEAKQMDNREIVKKSICNMCFMRCGIDAYLRNGKIYKITEMERHPVSPLCRKAAGLLDWVYSAKRIMHPMRKIDGKWKEISWNEAIGFVSGKLFDIKEKFGARSAAVFSGIAFAAIYDVRAVISRWGQLYGTPNLTTGATYCHHAHVIGWDLTFNYEGPTELRNDFVNAKCIINWGRNPQASRHIMALDMEEGKRRGAKLIVIDPRVTETAEKADIHVQIRPGTDCALALGMLNVIIAEELYDKDFVDKWSVGFEQMADHVKKYTPEKVAEITWVPSDVIRQIARTYATTKPASITHYISVDHSLNGVQTTRAIAILIAITGNLDVVGGDRICPLLKTADLSIKGLPRGSKEKSIGEEYPLFTKFTGHPTGVGISDAILTGKPYPIKALIVDAGNPALTWPNSNKVHQALSKLDLLVVLDLFMTETAKMADVFLPVCTNLENKFLAIYSTGVQMPYICRAEPTIAPIGESLPDWKIWTELGREMFGKEYFPWEDADEIYEAYLRNTGITIDQLKEHPEGMLYSEWEEKPYIKRGFKTPSGKVEIYSKFLEENGYDPLPTYHEASETPISAPSLVKDYPFIAMTGPRIGVYTHSQFRNVPTLRNQVPEPVMEINTETAKESGISDGDLVKVESPRGAIEMRAKTTGDIHPRVLSIPHGWSGQANANFLTNDIIRDPISGYPPFRSVLCRVTKL